MKFSSSAILAISALSYVHAESGLRNRLSTTESKHRKLGKKDCITDDATVIDSCNFVISKAGRYILEDDLKCDAGDLGISVTGNTMDGPVSDVYINCQGNSIIGDKATRAPGTYAIGVGNDATDVTIADCKGRFFGDGVLASGGWTGLTVTGSSFKYNSEYGMDLIGNDPDPSTLTVIDSKFSENGIDGINSLDVDGTYISVVANKNVVDGIYLDETVTTMSTLIDTTTNDNGDSGVYDIGITSLSVIGSTACDNLSAAGSSDLDLTSTTTAQANTCGTSFPSGLCECSCKGNSKSSPSLDMAAAVEDAGVADANSTVAVSNTTIPTKTKDKGTKKISKPLAVP